MIEPSAGAEAPDFYTYLRRFTEMGRAVHAAAEKLRSAKPAMVPLSVIEDALRKIDEAAKDLRWSGHWRCGLGQAHRIMSEAIASAMSARSGETVGLAPKDASAVPQADAQGLNP